MSVLIKGMKKPKDCYQCRLHYGNGECGVSVDGNCPLIELPDHGDLIDMDEFSRAMYHEAFEVDSDMQKWESGCWIRYKMFERLRDSAPVVIPAERE